MIKTQAFSKNRQVIYDLLHRAKTFHCPVSSCLEYDCTKVFILLREMRRQGVPASFSAFLVKATAHLLEQYPVLNSHLFTKWNGTKVIAQFEDISCNMIIQRAAAHGEKILLPLVVHKANEKSISEIEEMIQFHKTAPLEELPQFKNFEKIKKMPSLLLRFISYKTRSDPEFYLRYYGTYGLSTLYSFKSAAISGSTVANTAIAFLPYNILSERGHENEGENGRRILRMGIVMDHYVLDGQQMSEAGYNFKRIIENPEKLLSLPSK